MFHMSFTYVLHPRPLRICIRTPSSGPIDRSPGGFWDSANAYPELLRGGRCKLVVVALEVGGRWSTEAASFIRQLAQTRCRAAPAALQTATAQAYIARWSALLTHAAQTAFAKSLLFEDLWLHTAGDGEFPLLSDLLDLRTTPPDISRPLDLLLDFALGLRGNLETGQYKNSLPTTKLLGDQMDMAEKGVRKKTKYLVGGLEHFLFFHVLGRIISADKYFSEGSKHQPVMLPNGYIPATPQGALLQAYFRGDQGASTAATLADHWRNNFDTPSQPPLPPSEGPSQDSSSTSSTSSTSGTSTTAATPPPA